MSGSTVVAGDVNVFGGDLQGENLATIEGQVNSDSAASLPLSVPGGLRVPIPNIDLHFNPVWDFFWLLFQSFMWAALAVLVVLFAAESNPAGVSGDCLTAINFWRIGPADSGCSPGTIADCRHYDHRYSFSFPGDISIDHCLGIWHRCNWG